MINLHCRLIIAHNCAIADPASPPGATRVQFAIFIAIPIIKNAGSDTVGAGNGVKKRTHEQNITGGPRARRRAWHGV